MDNKHRKFFVIKQSKGRKFMSKCTDIRLTAGLRPNPLGEFMPQWGPIYKEREGRRGTYF